MNELEETIAMATVFANSIDTIWNIYFFVIFGISTTYGVVLGTGSVVIPTLVRTVVGLAITLFGVATHTGLSANYDRLYKLYAVIGDLSQTGLADVMREVQPNPVYLYAHPVGILLVLVIVAWPTRGERLSSAPADT